MAEFKHGGRIPGHHVRVHRHVYRGQRSERQTRRQMEDRASLPVRHRVLRGRINTGGGHSTLPSLPPKRIVSSVDENCRVSRVYQSTPYSLPYSHAKNYDSYAFSFAGTLDATNPVQKTISPKIIQGGPATGNDTNVVFENFITEFAWYSNVFRYAKIKKMEMIVQRLPALTMVENQSYSDPPGTNYINEPQNKYTIFMGKFFLLPWAGQPGRYNYNDGTVSNADNPDDFLRYKIKHVCNASTPNGDQKELICPVWPVSVTTLAELSDDSTEAQIAYNVTPPVDIYRFNSSEQNLNSYGWQFMWWHPELSSTNNQDGSFVVSMYWKVEMEYYGLRSPSGIYVVPPEEDSTSTSGRTAQLLAMGYKVPKPVPDTRDYVTMEDLSPANESDEVKGDSVVVSMPTLGAILKAEEPKDTEISILKRSVSQAPKVAGKVVSRPNTPVKK